MKKICTALFASLMLVAFSAPAWANGASHEKKQCSKKNTVRHGHHHKHNKHKHKVLKQYKKLKKTYNHTMKDARQMFLEYLGSNQPCPDTDVSAIREEYEQQIAQLNETIASQEQQITGLNTTIASQEQQIAGLNTTIASQEQQIAGLNTTIASQEQQITDLSTTLALQQQQLTELNATIASLQQQLVEANDTITAQQEQIDSAYNDGLAAGMDTCAATEPAGDPQLLDSWSTGSYYPYALDVDNNGNTYIVERNYRNVVGYNSAGAQIAQWTSATLGTPVDLATDSQGNIYILDQSASEFLQKYTPGGQPMAFVTGSIDVIYPQGLFIDSQDNVYITDLGGEFGGRILKFDSTGALTATFGEVSDFELFGDEYCDIAVDEANQNIYVVTHYNHMVAKFGMDGTYMGAWSGDLRNPNSIAIGAQGQIFVADTYNDQIDQYDADGNLIYTISSDQLSRPTRIVVDNAGKLSVSMENYHSVQVYQ
jgi:uncharacterized coiled-coil protein SlyX/sugar lactone lactonase YvrE